ncbi:MAG: glycosyltransferase family 4 protein [Phycisphaeraceae bacterium]
MRITFILPFAGLSGGIRIVACLAEGLRQRGHEVAAVSLPPHRVGVLRNLRNWARGRGWTHAASQTSHLDGTSVDHRVIERERPIVDRDVPDGDVVIATFWETAEWVARLSPAKGAKAYFVQQYEANFGFPEERVAATWRLPLHKIVCSQWLADLGRQRFGQSIESVVPNGVDLDQFQGPPRGKQTAPTIGMMYAHHPVKGCAVSLGAVREVARQLPAVRLLAFGNQPVIGALPLPAGASFSLTPSQEAIRQLYNRCDVWLCASRSEGFHLPPHEAMACRCPVVSTRVGGPMDMIADGVNGYLVEVDDQAGLADRLRRVLSQSDQDWRRMSQAAHATAGRFTWELAVRKFERAVQRAVAEQAPARVSNESPTSEQVLSLA